MSESFEEDKGYLERTTVALERELEPKVIEELNTKGIEDPETKKLLIQYIDNCHTQADIEATTDPESSVASNRANIKAEIKIALLYSKTKKYKDQARESLEEALIAASQNDSTHDLAQEIEELISKLEM